MKYIDVHGHVNFPAYDADRDAVIDRAHKADVGMISVGTDLELSKSAIELAEKNTNMWAIVGLHPVFCGESHNDPQETGNEGDHVRAKQEFDYQAFRKLAEHPKVVAIGECGLDFFHSGPEDVDAQKEVFIQHIKLANEVGKPLMLHVRNSKDASQPSAYLEALKILKEHSQVKANFHFFAGTMDEMNAILKAGYYLSFTGVLSFARSYDEQIKNISLDRIMTETDCPYVAPAPYRGKRNEPSYVVEVVKAIAKIRGESEDTIAKQVMENVKTFFNLK
jgi:TatD DNase family protein